MACRLFGWKPLFEPMLDYFILNEIFRETFQWNWNQKKFSHKNIDPKISSAECRPFCLGPNVLIDLSHKFQQAPVLCTTMPRFVTEMGTDVHISVTKWYIVAYLSDALWDL